MAKVMVTETTMKNKNVENCIKAKIKTWKFPAPAGGGIVEVNYPFVLRSGPGILLMTPFIWEEETGLTGIKLR